MCYLTLKLGNKYFTDKFIVLQDLQRNLILGIRWQFNYKIGCNWNISGHHYMTHNNSYLCISIPSKATKTYSLKCSSVLLTTQECVNHHSPSTNKFKTTAHYELSTSDDLPLGLIHVTVNYRINHKYLKLLSIPILNMA